jgi:WD40 repeat protein
MALMSRPPTLWNVSNPAPRLFSDSISRFERFAPQGQSLQYWDGEQLVSAPWEITKRGRFNVGTDATVIAKFPNGIGLSASLRNLSATTERYVNLQQNGKLQVWSLKDNSGPLFELQHPDQSVIWDFTLSDDGELLASIAPGGKCLVWDLSETPPRPYPHTGAFADATHPLFTGDGKLLIGGDDKGMSVYEWATNRLSRRISYGRVTNLVKHPDGQHVATVNGNGTIYILRIPELADHVQK